MPPVMEPPRSFKEIPLKVSGVQLGKHRFADSELHVEGLPTLAYWRCNLTALSYLHNLYFVAYQEKVFVYRPQFPTQSLLSDPVLVIDTQPSSLGLSGFIDRRNSHAINHLTVQVLGLSEVLAVVRDDGDVDAYLTRHIQQAIERRFDQVDSSGLQGADVKPFFHRNVGKSAWGLAIHSEARMIAVSSNNLQITVFTFALTQQRLEDFEEDFFQEEQTYHSGVEPTPPSDRKENDIRILQNGSANIPSIAFCNDGQDPTGKWLVSTDIMGVVRSWDVHTLTRGGAVLASIQPKNHFQDEFDMRSINYDRMNAGWSIMFLPKWSFQRTKTLPEALGLQSSSRVVDEKSESWDASSSIGLVRGNADTYSYRAPVDVVDGNYLNPTEVQPRAEIVSGGRTHALRVPPRSNNNENVVQTQGHDGEVGVPLDNTRQSDSPDSDDNMHDAALAEANYSDYNRLREIPQHGLHPPTEADASGENRHARAGRPKFHFHGTSSLCLDIRSPLLSCTVSAIYLFQPPRGDSARGHAPVIALNDPFEQETPLNWAEYYNMVTFDRCNMHAQIPWLGVVVIATQKGRVAILSLTQIKTEAADPVAPCRVSYRRVYGYRIDHILPLASQEAAGHRPPSLLHGIAVGPMQGSEGLPDESKRWRLMVMYQDHSVLSYEIGRADDEVKVSGMDVII